MVINKLDGFDKIRPIYDERKKSGLVKWLMLQAGINVEQAAESIGVSVGYFNNKLHRDSFSLEDIVRLAYCCGYDMGLIELGDEQVYRIGSLGELLRC